MVIALHLEDSDLDAELVANRLAKAGVKLEIVRATGKQDFVERLSERAYDIILSDYQVPSFEGLAALDLAREMQPETPFLFVSGAMGEELAVESLKRGATDYVLKNRLARLPAAVERALSERRERAERIAAQHDQKQKTERLRVLWKAASVLLSSSDPDAMLRELFVQIRDSLGLDVYLNFMVAGDGHTLKLASQAGLPEETAAQISTLSFGQAVCGTVAQIKKGIVACRIQESDEPMVQLIKSLGFRAYACNPLLSGERLMGTLSFATRSRDEFAADEIEFLETVCHYVAFAYERVQLIQQLRRSDRRKDEFLATLAHELRNPLAPIRNSLHILQLTDTDPATRPVLEVMNRQVNHMVRLVDDLLEVSRITRGVIDLRLEPIDIVMVIHSALEACLPLVEAAGHDLHVRLPDAAITVNADAVRLAQVIENLLNNATKYTPQRGTIWLTVGVDGKQAVISVRDTGMGLPANMLERVFDMFVQVQRDHKPAQGGLGIGLALSKQLVEMHGGAIRVQSNGPGQGCEFRVLLPLAKPASAANAKLPSADHAPPDERRRILIVDDNEDAANSFQQLLTMMGHEVHVANDGPSAIDVMSRDALDVVLLDLGMPGMSGYEVAQQIRSGKANRDVKLIALTGWGQDEDRHRTRSAGFDHHLVKPIDLDGLRRLL